MVAQLSIGSSSQPSLATFATYSSIFSCSLESRFESDRNSVTKSGQIWWNFLRSSLGIAYQRLLGIQAASGERFAPSGSVNPALESKHTPVPSCSVQFAKR